MREQYRSGSNQACDAEGPSAPYNWKPNFKSIDTTIASTETKISFLESELKSSKAYLAQLKAVRKSVSPEDEAKIKALIEAGLI